MQIPCDQCNQLGYTIKEDCKCDKCSGTGLKNKTEEYNLNIKKGSYDGKEIVLKEKGDYNKEFNLRGDLIITKELPTGGIHPCPLPSVNINSPPHCPCHLWFT